VSFADLWPLDPAVDYLNHGSFGACPRAILERQSELRLRLEHEPVDFLVRALPSLLAEARVALAGFVGADGDDLAFVPNATAGVNAVVRSLAFSPGEELLTTDHAYAACKKTLDYVASRTGARVVVARVPFPLGGEDDVIEPVLAAVTPRTRLAMLDHVTSPTALVFPIERLVAGLSARGVDTLVDGAHALGMIPLDLARLGAAYYTANAHKWLCAPKGAAFLHVRKDRQKGLHPVAISHGYAGGEARFKDEFDWTGTSGLSPLLDGQMYISHIYFPRDAEGPPRGVHRVRLGRRERRQELGPSPRHVLGGRGGVLQRAPRHSNRSRALGRREPLRRTRTHRFRPPPLSELYRETFIHPHHLRARNDAPGVQHL
jgi:isopenicillin-N epimerase